MTVIAQRLLLHSLFLLLIHNPCSTTFLHARPCHLQLYRHICFWLVRLQVMHIQTHNTSVITLVLHLQTLDADALSALMASVNLHSSRLQTPDRPSTSQQQLAAASHNNSASPGQTGSAEATSDAARDQPVLASLVQPGLLADCPLPFAGADTAPATPARGRRPARRAPAKLASPEEAGEVCNSCMSFMFAMKATFLWHRDDTTTKHGRSLKGHLHQ